ncbi:MAG TPA: PLP-dependent transferase [Bacteroidales bacterium]|nr:PLP-dependent transferase [Bacteroidales bacterium]
MNPYFEPIPCGATLPLNNPHAVSVSIPTMQQIIAYEENQPGIDQIIRSGYPRFVVHPYVKQIIAYVRYEYIIPDDYEIMLLSSEEAARMVAINFEVEVFTREPEFGIITVSKNYSQLTKLKEFIRHCGYLVSSRCAEDYLYCKAIITQKFEEERILKHRHAEITIKQTLAALYQQPYENIELAVTGMNAVFSTFMYLKHLRAAEGKTIFLQLGWLYTDTIQILSKFSTQVIVINHVADEALIQYTLETYGKQIAAVFTEVPTNPLVQTVNLGLVRQLCNRFEIPIVVDSSVGTAVNLNLQPFADIIVESLTKFASGGADVLAGAIIFNKNSTFGFSAEGLHKWLDPLYGADMCRLGFEIKNYEERVQKIAANTVKLVQYFETKPIIKKIYWCLSAESAQNYKQSSKNSEAICGLISLTFNAPFAKIYDAVNLPKGPSLGTNFTLLMPYVYLAHYEYITDKTGQEILAKAGIPAELLRISVGLEPIDEIIAQFETAFNFSE